MDTPIKEPKIQKELSAGTRRVVLIASVIAAFLLGTTIHLGDTNTQTPKQQAKQVVSDIAKVLGHQPVDQQFNADVDQQLMWKVKDELKAKYLRTPLDEKEMYYGAIKGMVAALGDQYSVFFDPTEAKAFADELNGAFEGIGAEIGMRNNMITVIAPLPDSPAMKAGIRAKDVIGKIDDKYTDGMSTDEAVRLIRGKGGTPVKLVILHDKSKTPVEVTIVRKAITFDSVRSKMLPDGYAHIEVFHFNEETPALFKKAITDLSKQNPKGWILDVRNNPGGLLTAAVDMLGEFVPNEVAIQERDKTGITDTMTAYGEGRLKGQKVVALVNGGSASASEIVVGCLQDYKAATLIGDQTFGKGVVQELEDLPGGAELKVTVAEWLTGKGRSIDKVGVTPDIKVELKVDDVNSDRDPQLDRAIQFLKTGK